MKYYTPRIKSMMVPYSGLGMGIAYIYEDKQYELKEGKRCDADLLLYPDNIWFVERGKQKDLPYHLEKDVFDLIMLSNIEE